MKLLGFRSLWGMTGTWKEQIRQIADAGYAGYDGIEGILPAAPSFEEALGAERQAGVEIGHETHRGRLLFAPWDTASYEKQLPEFKLTTDFSHWVTVCERLPDDQTEVARL